MHRAALFPRPCLTNLAHNNLFPVMAHFCVRRLPYRRTFTLAPSVASMATYSVTGALLPREPIAAAGGELLLLLLLLFV
jgi:hypothetical protein